MTSTIPTQVSVQTVSTDREFEMVFAIRQKVLQEEFGVPEEFDLDGHDHIAHHYLALVDGKAVGTARWRITLGRKVKLERFAVLPELRGEGIGKALLESVLEAVPRDMETYLEAHGDVVPFYEAYGFQPDGQAYDVSGIPHQRMVYRFQES